jgi:hypothetical protein
LTACAGGPVVRRHERADVADDEQVARTGARQQVGDDARIRAADEQDRRMLAVANEVLELVGDAWKVVVVKPTQPLQQLVRRRRRCPIITGFRVIVRHRRRP